MESEIALPSGSKKEQYEALLPQVKALIQSDVDLVANMANVAAALKTAFNFFWVGFYRVQNNQLVLGPFQGPVACTTIYKGKGVCGQSWEKEQTIIVGDVNAYPGHIACSPHSKSEIVLPIIKNESIIGVLDIDSDQLNSFDKTDQEYLELMLTYL